MKTAAVASKVSFSITLSCSPYTVCSKTMMGILCIIHTCVGLYTLSSTIVLLVIVYMYIQVHVVPHRIQG